MDETGGRAPAAAAAVAAASAAAEPAAAAAGAFVSHPGRSRLAWRCRRGTLELDLLLHGWLERHYERATGEQRAQFAALLELPDPVLAAYLMGVERPPQPALGALIEAIRASRALLPRGGTAV